MSTPLPVAQRSQPNAINIVDTVRSNLIKLNITGATALVRDLDNKQISPQEFLARARTLSNLTAVDSNAALERVAARLSIHDAKLTTLARNIDREFKTKGEISQPREEYFKAMENILAS